MGVPPGGPLVLSRWATFPPERVPEYFSLGGLAPSAFWKRGVAQFPPRGVRQNFLKTLSRISLRGPSD